jgi:hypothetical protein
MVLWVTGGDQKQSLVGGAGVEPATSPLLAFGALFQAELSAFSRFAEVGRGDFCSVHVIRRTLTGLAAYRSDEPWGRVTLR